MWNNKKVSVVFPTYNEAGSIREAIDSYFASGYVDEIVVVNNNALGNTKEEVNKTRAIQVFEKKQGYGYALQRGLDEVTGDLILLSEPDGTFSAKDIIKFLAYSGDYDAVWGTRTDIRFIEKGANMGIMMRFAFNTTRLSDVGCTFKLYKKEVIEKLKGGFTVGKQHFGPELMMLTALNGFSAIEIPINYRKRVGNSSVTGHPVKALVLASKMFFLVMRYWLVSIICGSKK
jgi:glycosyltransferase involved in cell wall biosynthesis